MFGEQGAFMSTTSDIAAGGTSAAELSGAMGAVGVREATSDRARGWFTRAVTRYMRANLARLRGVAVGADGL